MPSKPNMIASLRGKHDPHYKLAGRVEGLEKDLPRQLNQLHKTLSKSFGMQRKTLMRVLGLEERVAELEAAEAAVDQAVEELEEELEELGEEIPEGLDEILDDVRGDKGGKKKKPAAKKKKRPATPTAKKIPKKKKPTLKAKKKKVSPSAFKKGTSQETISERIDRLEQNAQDVAAGDLHRQTDQYKETESGLDQVTGEQLSNEERIRRFKLRKRGISVADMKRGSSVGGAQRATQADTTGTSSIVNVGQASDLSTEVTPEGESGTGKGTAGLLAPLQAINASLDNINKSFIQGAKDDKKAADDTRKADEKKKRKGAEGALEKIGGVAVKGVQAVLKPAMGIFERIWNFLKTVLLGRIVMNVFDYFAKNQDKLASLFKFVKDWWPVMVAGILAIFGPILGPGAWIVGVGALIWWSVNRITALVKFVGNLFGNIWKFITGSGKDGDKAEAAALKDIDKETKGMEEPDLSKGEDPPSGDTAKLDKGQDAVDASQKLKAPQESGDEPVKMNKGGQVPGKGNTDTVPAMLTPGEFVMSKGAVQQYGVQTLEGMNAAAGGTNKPTSIGGFKGGGQAKDSPMDAMVNMSMDQMKKFWGITNTKAGSVSDGAGGFTMQTQEELNAENNAKLPLGLTMTEDGQNIDMGKFAGDKARMIGAMATDPRFAERVKEHGKKYGYKNLTGEQFQGIANKEADNLQFSINQFIPGTESHFLAGESASINESMSAQGYAGGGLVGRIRGSVKNISGRVRKALNPPVRHKHPVTVSYDNALLQQQRPLGEPPRQDLPSFDAGAMVSMSKIKTLGISV